MAWLAVLFLIITGHIGAAAGALVAGMLLALLILLCI